MVGVQKRKIQWAISLFLVLNFYGFPAQAQYGGGSGETNEPYLIYTAEQMNAIGAEPNDWDKHFKLMADINLSAFTGTSFNIIGYGASWFDNEPFTGVFDGNGKRISNFSYTSTDRGYVGLFGYVSTFGKVAVIKNLGLIDPNVDAGTTIGSLVGSLEEGTITNCYVEGVTVSGRSVVGGLVGENRGTITNCSTTGTVLGFQHVGGLVGENAGGKIINCTSSASVARTTLVGGNTPVGGLVGSSYGTIVNCYATGDVAGNTDAGGLVGENNGTITNCYATGSVLGNSDVGGLVGRNWSGTITNCHSTGSVSGSRRVGGLVGGGGGGTIASFWDIETSGQATSDGGMGKTTAEMQKPNIFMDAGWDFVGQPDEPHDIWAIPIGGGYPILCWQISPPPALPTFSGGTGEPDNPYLISTADELNSIGHNPRLMRAHFKLIDDIDLSGIDFFIIGSELYPFGGVFDGYGKKISNFTYTSTEQDFVGLFRYVEVAEIKDLGLIEPNVDAGTGIAVGSLAGHLKWVLVDTCYVEGGSVSGNGWVGGLVGSYGNAFMTDCFTEDMSISGTEDYVGGLIGGNIGMIMQCYSSGCTVSGRAAIGGLVGANGGEIYDCYATDSVIRAGYQVGGLVGLQGYIYYGTIANCYATCNVFGFQYVGGLVGENEFGTITSSFWDTQTSGQTTSDGGTGKTTAEMQTKSTFTDAGWDFSTPIWTIDQGVDYPRLWREQQESSKYGGGTGEPNEPYLIYSAEQMNTIGADANDWDKHFKLMADIDLEGYTRTDFNIIGYYISDDDNKPFTGFFDGSGHTISNFSYSSKDKDRIGLFGYVAGPKAEIKDLGLINSIVDGGFREYVGSLIGYIDGGTISGCYTQDGTVMGGARVGGLVGLNDGLVTNCHSVSTVRGNSGVVGGLVGLNTGTLDNCYSESSVSGFGTIGGLVGENDGTITACRAAGNTGAVGGIIGGLVGKNLGTVSDCYAMATVGGASFKGGLVGLNSDTITKCYSVGRVGLGRGDVGGLVGKNDGGTVTESFWDIETSGQSLGLGIGSSDGISGKTTAEMQMESTFTVAGWDFVDESENGNEDIWWILEGQDYPRLWWELSD